MCDIKVSHDSIGEVVVAAERVGIVSTVVGIGECSFVSEGVGEGVLPAIAHHVRDEAPLCAIVLLMGEVCVKLVEVSYRELCGNKFILCITYLYYAQDK